jgi:uncharacterized repeat protein (TIGR01451 family)
MKKLSFIPKKISIALITLVTLALLGTAAVANFGPERPTRVWTPQENGFNYVTYNSYTSVPNGIGDERDFLRGVVKQRDNQWADPVKDIVNNDTVTAKILIHNNADPLLNDAPGNPGIARNVNVKVEIPKGVKQVHDVKSTISASNAQPTAVYDTLTLSGINDSQFELDFVPGSARLGNQILPDSIFTTGYTMDDQKGCFEYLREITFDMKVTKPGYQIQKTARIKGEDSTKWRKVVNAKRGDLIEWRISFQNIGSTQLNDVAVVDDLPSFTEVTPGSVELVNSNFPNGFKFGSDAVQNNGDQVNVNIDDYLPGSNAFLYLETKIVDAKEIQCGIHQIANVAYVTPAGLGTLNDNAKVNIINEECDKPSKPIYSCDAVRAVLLSKNKYQFTVDTTAEPKDRVSVKTYEFNFGDGSTKLLTDKNVAEHTYASDGTYKVTVLVNFMVDNQIKQVGGSACEVVVSSTTPPVTPPVTPKPPTTLPVTGAGSIAGIMAAVTAIGAYAHRAFTLKRQ